MAKDLTKLSTEQRAALKSLNVSDSIRYLDSEGFSRSDIAKILGKRYQHVRNVLVRSTESGARRKTLSFSAKAKQMQEFREYCQRLGFVPERYLNQVLNLGLDELTRRQPNSEKTLAILTELYYFDFEPNAEVSESVKLESPLVDRVGVECERMNLSVDFFVDACISTAIKTMEDAFSVCSHPFSHCQDVAGIDFLSDYVMTETNARDLQSRVREDERLAEAVAKLKEISFGAAQQSIKKLSRYDKSKLKANPDVKRILDKLAEGDDVQISLEDLLD